MIGIDFVGLISPTAFDGSQFILTISDYFNKWVEALLTPDNSVSSVATTLFKVSSLCACNVASYILHFGHMFMYLFTHTCYKLLAGLHAIWNSPSHSLRPRIGVQQHFGYYSVFSTWYTSLAVNTLPSTGIVSCNS